MSKASSLARPTTVCRNAAAPNFRREQALAIARADMSRVSDEEDAAITAAAPADPDAQPSEALARRRLARLKRSVR